MVAWKTAEDLINNEEVVRIEGLAVPQADGQLKRLSWRLGSKS